MKALDLEKIVKVDVRLSCGFPSPALDHLEERINLNDVYIKNPLATFIAEATGTSMINAFIPPGSKLIIDRSIVPKNGDIVLAILEGEFTIKFLRKNQYKCWLVPANSKFKEIEITEEMNMSVFGVVTTIIINSNEVKSCML